MSAAETASQEPPLSQRLFGWIAGLATLSIVVHLVLRFLLQTSETTYNWPLWIALAVGGVPLVLNLLADVWHLQFGSDLLAGISIITSVLLGEYLAGTLVVLMLSGGGALEGYAVQSASSVLRALAKRMPSVAHLQLPTGSRDVTLDAVKIGDSLLVYPHEICPVDGLVLAGHGVMDESYLTGEPFTMSKTPGSEVFSGAINGETALTIEARRLAVDSRYANIMKVMQTSEQHRPRLRRLGDQLGAFYTPLAIGIAALAWWSSGQPSRFLAVLVVATPCPLLIGIPVAIIGAISLSARRGIIIKNPVVLEQLDTCRTVIFDKTGTLTYGEPTLTDLMPAAGFDRSEVLRLAASLERYSKHPLAAAILNAAAKENLPLADATTISERPGEGLRGVVLGRDVSISSRKKIVAAHPEMAAQIPDVGGGLECLLLVDGRYAAAMRFRDVPREEGVSFVRHLRPKHQLNRMLLVSGDRESEVRYLADCVGITEVFGGQSPEQKLEIVRRETQAARTIFLGDGINDAPALTAATVGVAFGQNSDITSEAADAVILEASLRKFDEFLHVSRRMRRIALQSAMGGMAASVIGMVLAASGYLPPVAGAICQELIDLAAVLNALRASFPPRSLSDF